MILLRFWCFVFCTSDSLRGFFRLIIFLKKMSVHLLLLAFTHLRKPHLIWIRFAYLHLPIQHILVSFNIFFHVFVASQVDFFWVNHQVSAQTIPVQVSSQKDLLSIHWFSLGLLLSLIFLHKDNLLQYLPLDLVQKALIKVFQFCLHRLWHTIY